MSNWQQFTRFFLHSSKLGISVDLSRMGLDDAFLDSMKPACDKAWMAINELERGAIANPDENRMVGHYWLRDAALAPAPEIRAEIEKMLHDVVAFANSVHTGAVKPQTRARFTRVLSVGIGGSALGPQFVSEALGQHDDKMKLVFLDNTDPDGFDRILSSDLSETLTVVISKSGSTPETLNGMLEAAHAFKKQGLDFARHAVAVTGDGSVLFKQASRENWLSIFPMWDWVGGRTSVMSAVGLVGMALQGLDVQNFLHGARDMDGWTRAQSWQDNPALALALAWYKAGDGKGLKDMVVLPYKDRLALFSRYLQQLVMESLGKEKDLQGKVVHQGIAVYGNKGSTDQHAYVQQLRDGLNNFFATFVVVLKDRDGEPFEVETGVTAGDFLNGFWQGTRQALSENGRSNACITLPEVNAYQVGALIALYERTVSLYAQLVGINAYHQPGVEAGKKAAKGVLELQSKLLAALQTEPDRWFDAEALASRLEADPEAVFLMMRHLAANRSQLQWRGEGLGLEINGQPRPAAVAH
ncbi:glucose-6-phosphate isomerase [bacterium]|nr:glucose-6-phosphate isomerase [bacterium]